MFKRLIAALAIIVSATAEATIKNVDATGCRDGVWTEDLTAARTYAKKNKRPYIIVWGNNSGGCGLCNGAASATWNKDTFKAWAAENKIALVMADMIAATPAAKTTQSLYLSGQVSGIALPVFFAIDGMDGVSRLGFDQYHAARVCIGEGPTAGGMYGVNMLDLPITKPMDLIRWYINKKDDSPTSQTAKNNNYPIGPRSITPDAENTKEEKLSVNGLYGEWETNDLSTYNYIAGGSGKVICINEDKVDWYTFNNAKAGTSYIVKTPTLTDKNKEGYMGVYTNAATATAAAASFKKAKSSAAYWISMNDLKKGRDFTIPKKGQVWLLFTRRDASEKENITVKYTFTLKIGSLEDDKFAFSKAGTSISEAATNQTVTVGLTRTLATAANSATVAYGDAGDTAAAGVDYAAGATSVPFSGTSKTASLQTTVLASRAGVWTGDRTFTIKIAEDGAKGGITNHVVTIKETDAEFDATDPQDDVQTGAQNLAAGTTATNRLNSTDTTDWFRFGDLPGGYFFRLTAVAQILNNANDFSIGFFNAQGVQLGTQTMTVATKAQSFDLPPAWFANGAIVYAKAFRGSSAAPVCCVYALKVAKIAKPSVAFKSGQTTTFVSPSANVDATFGVTVPSGGWAYSKPTVKSTALTAVDGTDYVGLGAAGKAVDDNGNVTLVLKDAGKWRPERTFKLNIVGDSDGFYAMGSPNELTVTIRGDSAEPAPPMSPDRPIPIGTTPAMAEARNLSNVNTNDTLYFSASAGANVLSASDVTIKPADTEIDVNVFTQNVAGAWVKYNGTPWKLSDLANPDKMPVLDFTADGIVMVVVSRKKGDEVLATYSLGFIKWDRPTIQFSKASWTTSQSVASPVYTLTRSGDTNLAVTAYVTLQCGTARKGVDVKAFTDKAVTFEKGVKTATVAVENLMTASAGMWKGDRTFTLTVAVKDEKLAVGRVNKAEVVLKSAIPEYEDGDTAAESIIKPARTNEIAEAWTSASRTLNGADEKDWFLYTGVKAGVRYLFTLELDESSTNNLGDVDVALYVNGDTSSTKAWKLANILGKNCDFTATADGQIVIMVRRGSKTSLDKPVSMAYTFKARKFPLPVFGMSVDKTSISDAKGQGVVVKVTRSENTEAANSVILARTITAATSQSGFAASANWAAGSNSLTLKFAPGQTETNLTCTVKTGLAGVWTGDWSFKVELKAKDASTTNIDADAAVSTVSVNDCDPEKDARDAYDDTKEGVTPARAFAVGVKTATQTGCRLNGSDTVDWFRFTGIESGKTYIFQVVDTNFVNVSADKVKIRVEQDNGASWIETTLGGGGSSTVQFVSGSSGDIYVRLSRSGTSTAEKPVSVAYSLSYRVQSAVVYLTAAKATVSEAAKYVSVNVMCDTAGAGALAMPVTVKVAPYSAKSDTATAPEDFDDTPIEVTWPEGSTGGVERVKVSLSNYDGEWEGDETFHIKLQDASGAELTENKDRAMYQNMLVKLTEISAPQYGVVELIGSSAKEDSASVKTVTSSTKLKAREGGKVTLRFKRTGGRCDDVLGKFIWYEGKKKLKTKSNVKIFDNLQDGTALVKVAVPAKDGFQKTQTFTLKYSLMPKSGATIKKKSLTSLTYTITDKDYAGKITSYSADDATKVPFSASGVTWFADRNGGVRSSNPAAGKSVVLTATVDGPGTLTFKATFENASNCKLTVKGGSKTVTASKTGTYKVSLKAGRQTLTFTFNRPKSKTKDTAAVAISDVTVTRGAAFNTIGTFYGLAEFVLIEGSATNVMATGTAKMTVASSGKISGKFVMDDGRTWTFSDKSGWDSKTWKASLTAKCDGETRAFVLQVDPKTGIVHDVEPALPPPPDDDEPATPVFITNVEMDRDGTKDVPQLPGSGE